MRKANNDNFLLLNLYHFDDFIKDWNFALGDFSNILIDEWLRQYSE